MQLTALIAGGRGKLQHQRQLAPSWGAAWYILEEAEGTVYLLPAEALNECRVPNQDAILLSGFVSGADLSGCDVEAALRLLDRRGDRGGARFVFVATRQVRAWVVLG